MLLEQAVFTSCRTELMDGYQLLGTSPGVTREQSEELAKWGPAHDSLLHPDSSLGSINFHRLADGHFCISKTVPSGAEYSGRAGPRVYTTCLLAAPEAMRHYCNQPFRILDAAIANGHLRVQARQEEMFPSIRLRGRASRSMPSLIAPLRDERCRDQVLSLIEFAAAHELVLVQGAENVRRLIDWAINLLPLECRVEFLFSTGLKFSSQRTFRLMVAPNNELDCEQLVRQNGAVVWTPHQSEEEHLRGAFVNKLNDMLRRGQAAALAQLLDEERPEINLSTLLATDA